MKIFLTIKFREVLLYKISNNSISKNDERFETSSWVYWEVIDRFAPRKQKYLKRNNTPFMNKTLSKEIMRDRDIEIETET